MWWSKDDENNELKVDQKNGLKYHYPYNFMFIR